MLILSENVDTDISFILFDILISDFSSTIRTTIQGRKKYGYLALSKVIHNCNNHDIHAPFNLYAYNSYFVEPD